MIPTSGTWTVIFSKESGAWGSFSYDQKEDAARVTAKPEAAEFQERLGFSFDEPTRDAVVLAMRWEKIRVPVYSIGLWTKVDLHLNGNIAGYQRVTSPKKLLVLGASTLFNAVADFSSVAFHEKFLLPFYDWCLKGKTTAYNDEPNVRYFVGGAEEFKTSETWPPGKLDYKAYFLRKAASGSMTSLNDGSLDTSGPDGGGTVFEYPNSGWRVGACVRLSASRALRGEVTAHGARGRTRCARGDRLRRRAPERVSSLRRPRLRHVESGRPRRSDTRWCGASVR